MENEYQLRLKDMNYNEKIKELTEKFIQEMESLKTKNQVRRKAEKNSKKEEMCPGLNSSTKFMKTAKIRNFRKIRSSFDPLSSQATCMNEEY